MNITRKCAHCGREFSPQSGSQKYCCEQCADTAKQNKKKQKREMFKAIEPMAMVQCQEYLTLQMQPSSWVALAITFTS